MAKKRLAPPAHIRITKKASYEVLYTDEFKSDHVGETRFDPKQIIIKKGLSPSEEASTVVHELLHAIDHEEPGKPLTETNILRMERGLHRAFRLNPELLLSLYEFYKKK